MTLRFTVEFGGRRLYVGLSKRLRSHGRLVQAVGSDAAALIVDHFGSAQMISVPLGPLSLVWLRTMRMRALIVAGWSVSDIARDCLVTERCVWKQKALLTEFGVIARREPVRVTSAEQVRGSVRLLLVEGMPVAEIARQLDVPALDVEREAETLKSRSSSS